MGNSLLKLVQRNRNNENENQYLLSLPPIFKLNGHCFDELFDYLSLKDLHSLGQTSKSMQQMTGTFFKFNYSAQFITSITIGINILKEDKIRHDIDGLHHDLTTKLNYLKLHADELKLVKKNFISKV